MTGGQGILTYIQPNKFFNSDYGEGIRKLISSGKYLKNIIDFKAQQVFSTATTYTCILFCTKYENDVFQFVEFNGDNPSYLFSLFARGNTNKTGIVVEQYEFAALKNDIWTLTDSYTLDLFKRIEKHGKKLAFYTAKTFVGLQTSADTVYILEERGGGKLYSKQLKEFVQVEPELLKPLLKGSDILRYIVNFNHLWLIFPYEIKDGKAELISTAQFQKKYPLAWNSLKKCTEKLKGRDKGNFDHDQWYAFGRTQNLEQFEQVKLMIQVLAKRAAMIVDDEAKYYFVGGGNAGGYGLTLKSGTKLDITFLNALLNSALSDFYLQHHSSRFQNGYFSYAKRFLDLIPIVEADAQTQKQIADLARKIIELKQNEAYSQSGIMQSRVTEYEKQIDDIVFKLYGFTEEKDIRWVRSKLAQLSEVPAEVTDEEIQFEELE